MLTEHRPWRRVVVATAVAAGLITVIVLSRRTLTRSVTALGGLDFRWFLLGVACEVISLAAFGLSRRRLLSADGHHASFGSVMAITYAGNALSMSVPFAGAELALVFSYRQFRRRGLDPALTGWALAVSAMASSSALALILIAGAAAGGAPLATAAGFAGGAAFALPALTVVLAVRYPRARVLANRVIAWAVPLARRLFRKPDIDPAVLDGFLHRLATIQLGWPAYAEVFGLAVLNWLADCACLVCAVKAAGAPVPWAVIVLIYGAGAAVGSTGITPGGLAVVEVTLTAALTAAGLTAAHALTAVLAYRVVNFWLILAAGGVTMVVLTHTRDSRVRRYPRAAPAPPAPPAAPAPPAETREP